MAEQNNIKGFLVNCLWRQKENRVWCIAGLSFFLLEFVLFKFHYPYANYTGDSYYYLEAAASNADVSTWPVAYSKFLRLSSVFTDSDTIVVAMQYFLLQVSTLVFLFSLQYLILMGVWVKRILLAFAILNPVPLYIANYIGSDALFIGISQLWLSSLLWIIYQPGWGMLIGHAFLLLGCFVIRYNAIYYPGVSLVAFILSPDSRGYKVGGLMVSAALLLGSIWFTREKMAEVTGQRQFSAFSGWQLANNALYMYEHIPAADRGRIDPRFVRLETMVRQHMDTLRKVKLTQHDIVNTNFYLWDERGPLVHYMNREFKGDRMTPEFKKWATEGPLYSEYGLSLIRKYPVQYIQWFMLPNALKFSVPPREFLGMYNMGLDSVARIAKDWFGYKSVKITDRNTLNRPIQVTAWYPVFGALINVLFLMSVIGMVAIGGFRQTPGIYRLVFFGFTLWLLNCGFSIFSAPIVLRYQIFPIMVAFSFGLLFIDRILKLA